MRSLLAKLQELVPSMPRNKRVSKLEIILSVIDYIVHLETTLEAHSAARASTPVASVRHCCRRDFLLITASLVPLASFKPFVMKLLDEELLSVVFLQSSEWHQENNLMLA
ncbi:DNA-binding protein inhibitor ID-2-A-like [Dermacentor albipictus]|uniref:DNA-binding protein inhibitor ID-2-A-like n=1 Tax=Dermacentor albipictus TaxID=60249 RepID=UPI0038FD19DE